MKTVDVKPTSAREYMQGFRDQWAALGYAQRSNMIHDLDAKLISAYASICKFTRALEAVRADDQDYINFLCDRNKAKGYSALGMEELEEDIKNEPDKEKAALAKRYAAVAKTHARAAKKLRILVEDTPTNRKKRAELVCHTNLSTAYFKYAEAVFDMVTPTEEADV